MKKIILRIIRLIKKLIPNRTERDIIINLNKKYTKEELEELEELFKNHTKNKNIKYKPKWWNKNCFIKNQTGKYSEGIVGKEQFHSDRINPNLLTNKNK